MPAGMIEIAEIKLGEKFPAVHGNDFKMMANA
jgi:hypothetical protein